MSLIRNRTPGLRPSGISLTTIYLELVLKRIRHRHDAPRLLPLAALALALVPTTGCLRHTRPVTRTRPADLVLTAPLDQILKQVDDQYKAVQSMTAFVDLVTTTGGSHRGEVTDYLSVSGFIIIGKPDQVRVILNFPAFGRILDMVSDGKTFKMYIPTKSCAIVGSDTVNNTSQKGLYSLRPDVILDSMLIRGLEPNQVVSETQDIRIVDNPKKKNDLIEEPDYDLEFFSQPKDQIARTLHVVHISRADLKPYQQDIYDPEGKVVTQAYYSDYQKFGDIDFPSRIIIKRPLDELALTITLGRKTNFNQKLADDEFKLDLPQGIATQNMDDAASATTSPCGGHAPQSKH